MTVTILGFGFLPAGFYSSAMAPFPPEYPVVTIITRVRILAGGVLFNVYVLFDSVAYCALPV